MSFAKSGIRSDAQHSIPGPEILCAVSTRGYCIILLLEFPFTFVPRKIVKRALSCWVKSNPVSESALPDY